MLGLSLETLMLQYRLREEEEEFAMDPEGKGHAGSCKGSWV